MTRPFPKIKILPLTIAVAFMLLGVKVNNVIEGKEKIEDMLVRQAIAQEQGTAAEAEQADATPADQPEETASAEEEQEDIPRDVTDKKQPFNQIELDILQSLAKRREEIERWSDELDVRESVLSATELRIDNKLNQMQALKQEVQALLDTYGKKQKQELQSLVKIYENMKPKDAARIFNELEMEILLDVVELMSERKAAPIIAEMDSKRAKALTEELADRRRLQMLNETMQQS
jgi:flagellar motility protein MotE (MotC chaperone)